MATPARKMRFMYVRSFDDIDGHHREILSLDPQTVQ